MSATCRFDAAAAARSPPPLSSALLASAFGELAVVSIVPFGAEGATRAARLGAALVVALADVAPPGAGLNPRAFRARGAAIAPQAGGAELHSAPAPTAPVLDADLLAAFQHLCLRDQERVAARVGCSRDEALAVVDRLWELSRSPAW